MAEDRFKYYHSSSFAGLVKDEEANDVMKRMMDMEKWDINDALEAYNWLMVFEDANMKLGAIRDFRARIAKNLAGVVEGRKVSEILWQYHDDFISAILRFRLVDRTLNGSILDHIGLKVILTHKSIVEKFSDYVVERIKSKPQNFELVLQGREIAGSFGGLFLPIDDYSDLLLKYIELDTAHPEYLKMIARGVRGLDKYALAYDEGVRSRAEKRHSEVLDRLFSDNNSGVGIEMMVATSKNQFDKIVNAKKEGRMVAFIDEGWLCKNNEPESVLNYIATHDNFFNSDRNLAVVHNERLEGLASIFGIRQKDTYGDEVLFPIQFDFVARCTAILERVLEKNGSGILELAYYYFEEYIRSVYNIEFPRVARIKDDYVLEHKTVLVCSYIEHILKCWVRYCTDGYVDAGVLNMMTYPLKMRTPSMVKDKYYSPSERGRKIMRLLMSDQCPLPLDTDLEGQGMVELFQMRDNRVPVWDEGDYKEWVKPLVDAGIVVRKGDVMSVVDWAQVGIYSDLWYGQSIGSFHHPKSDLDVIKKMKKTGFLDSYSGLLTNEEDDFFQYAMTNDKFSNSIGLRNRYSHGIPVYNNRMLYEKDHVLALLILLSLIIKIDDDLNQHFSIASGKTNYMELI